MKSPFGVASCTRVSMPSTPAMAKNTNDVIIMRMPMIEWLTAARRCSPGPVAQIAASSRCSRKRRRPLRQLLDGFTHFFSDSPDAAARASAAEKSSGRWTMTSNRIPA